MEAEVKVMLQKILTRQLEGIMFHFDAMTLYAMLGNWGMKHEHLARFKEESGNYANTVLAIIKKYHEHIEATEIKGRVKLNFPAELPVSKTDCEDMCAGAVAAWLKWEQETQVLYKQAADSLPDCKMISRLCKDVAYEIRKIERILKQ